MSWVYTRCHESSLRRSDIKVKREGGDFKQFFLKLGNVSSGINLYTTMSTYSKLLSMSSCFNTFVWLVSLSSPARNISSTML